MTHSDPAYGRKLSRAGLSAYEIAKKNGFVGDEAAWLLSLIGPPGADGTDGADGAAGADGLSAYQVAVANGFVGTEADWLLSLVGPAGADGIDGTNGTNGTDGADGADGASAYEVAVANGFVGDEATWLLSLVGPAGADGADGADGAPGTPGADGLPGADGAPGPAGADGDSAYEVAVANGFVGTEAAWLASLVGPAGAPGADGTDGVDGADAPLIPVQIMAAPDKTTPADADTFGYLDSTASNALVKFTWANIKTALQTFFEGLFRTKLSAPRTYYIRTDGSDSNNGLTNTAGGAFLTIQKAIDVATSLDNNGYDITLQMSAGTFAPPTKLKNIQGAGRIIIQGVGSTTLVRNTVNGTSSFGRTGWQGVYDLVDFKLDATGTACYGIGADGGEPGVLTFGGLDFGSFPSGGHIRTGFGGFVGNKARNYTISGGAHSHISCYDSGHVRASACTVTITGTPAFTAFALADRGGTMLLNGVTYSGAATGQRYNAAYCGGVLTFGGATYLPGNVAGVATSSGWYQ